MPNATSDLLSSSDKSYRQLTITHIKQLVNDTKLFYLTEQEGEPIQYKAGQYLTFIHPTHKPEARRSYSVTSAPLLQEPLAIGVKRVPNGLFSRYLYDQAKPGDQLISSGAGGVFTLPDILEANQQLFFFAAGVGITPIFSLLKTVLYIHPLVKVVLVYSNRNPEETLFRDELHDLANKFPDRFTCEFVFSNSANLAHAHLYPDLLISLVKQHAVAKPENLLSYICGPLNYQRMCLYGLRRAGLPAAAIRKENFDTTAPKALVLPPDTDTHQVTLLYKGREVRFPVQYPENILAAARKQGLVLPYSCEAGVCGNCLAKCVEGKVWLSYNEVLTERDLAKGLTLTCVGHPVGGNVVLDMK